jgi:hypothetical protein
MAAVNGCMKTAASMRPSKTTKATLSIRSVGALALTTEGLGRKGRRLMPQNIAVQYLDESGETIADYHGDCHDLASNILDWCADESVEIMYMEPVGWNGNLPYRYWTWDWHMVIVLDGVVHDAWFPDLMLPPSEYLEEAFPGVEVTFNIQDHAIRPKCVRALKLITSQ